MKRLLPILFCAAALFAAEARAATNLIQCYWQNQLQQPLAFRTQRLYPAFLNTNGQWMVSNDAVPATTDTNGYIGLVNVVPGTYFGTFASLYTTNNPFQITVPTNSGTFLLTSLFSTGSPTNASGIGYTIAQANGLFLGVGTPMGVAAGAGLSASTNTAGVSLSVSGIPANLTTTNLTINASGGPTALTINGGEIIAAGSALSLQDLSGDTGYLLGLTPGGVAGALLSTNGVTLTNDTRAVKLTNAANIFSGNGGGLTNVPLSYGGTIWVDAVNGSDSTGIRGDSGHPFATIGYAAPYLYNGLGLANSGAIGVAQSGDVIRLRPGAYTNMYVVLPPNVSLIGESALSTVIYQSSGGGSQPLLSVGPAVVPGSNSVIQNVTITCQVTNNYSAPFGLSDNPSLYITSGHPSTNLTVAPATGVRVINCILNGCTDGNYVNSTNQNTMKFFHCTFTSQWDTDALISTNSFDEFFNCDFLPTWNAASGSPGLAHGSATQAGTNRFVGCRFYSVGGTNANECVHLYTGSAYAFLVGCSLSTVSTNATAILADAGNVEVDGCRINSPTNWYYTTNSAVTNLYSTLSIATSNVFRGILYGDGSGLTNLTVAGSTNYNVLAVTNAETALAISVTNNISGGSLNISGGITNGALTASQAIVTDSNKKFSSLPYSTSGAASSLLESDASGNAANTNTLTVNRFTIYTNTALPTVATNGNTPSGTVLVITNGTPSDFGLFFDILGNSGSCTNFAQIIFGGTYSQPPTVWISPANTAAGQLVYNTSFGVWASTISKTNAQFTFANSTTLASSTHYLFEVHVFPKP